MNDEQTFLLKEYDSANELTFAVDELRNKISTFYGAFVTITFAGLGLFVKSGDQQQTASQQLGASLPILTFTLGVIGLFVVRALGRMRAAQLEHFRIINNIREYFLKADAALWSAVELSRETLPGRPTRKSGSYMWAAMVIFLSAALLGCAVFQTLAAWDQFCTAANYVLSIVAFLLAFAIEDRLYLDAAQPPPRKIYTKAPI